MKRLVLNYIILICAMSVFMNNIYAQTNKSALYHARYTLATQSLWVEMGTYTDPLPFPVEEDVIIYDSHITVGGREYPFSSVSGGWKVYSGPNIIGVTTSYYVNSSNYDMYRIEKQPNPYMGGYGTFRTNMYKGEVIFESPHNNTHNSTGSTQSGISQRQNSTASSTNRQPTKHTCPLCNGKKRIVKDTHPAMFGTENYKVRCDECGGYFLRSTGHTHVTCPQCHGKGYFTTD